MATALDPIPVEPPILPVPIATEFAVNDWEFVPIAIVFSSVDPTVPDFEFNPIAIEPLLFACEPYPIAEADSPTVVTFVPIAIDVAPTELAAPPTAIEPCPSEDAPTPNAVENLPEAFVLVPNAVAKSPADVACTPTAIEASPLAFVSIQRSVPVPTNGAPVNDL